MQHGNAKVNASVQTETKPYQAATKWNMRKNWILYVLLLPSVVFLLTFSYAPMIGVVIAFQNFSPITGFFHSPFVGLDWFKFIFHMPDFRIILYNTVSIAVLKIIFGQLAPIVFALLLNEVTSVRFKKSVQTLVYLPHFLSWVIVGGIFIDLLSTKGMINQLIQWFGGEPIFFLGSNEWFKFTLVGTDVWKGFGWGAILYLAALTQISPDLYESASMDGANRFQKMWNITLPGIMPTIILLAALSLGSVLEAGFDQILMLYNPAVYESGDIIDTFVYRQGLLEMQFSMTAAVGLFKSVVGFVLIVISNWLASRFANYRLF
jgi:putative aldouronate transport system permease protein